MTSVHLVPLQPGATDEPQLHWPPLHVAGGPGSLAQQPVGSSPKQNGRVPVQLDASSGASAGASVAASSHMTQVMGTHSQIPLWQASAA